MSLFIPRIDSLPTAASASLMATPAALDPCFDDCDGFTAHPGMLVMPLKELEIPTTSLFLYATMGLRRLPAASHDGPIIGWKKAKTYAQTRKVLDSGSEHVATINRPAIIETTPNVEEMISAGADLKRGGGFRVLCEGCCDDYRGS